MAQAGSSEHSFATARQSYYRVLSLGISSLTWAAGDQRLLFLYGMDDAQPVEKSKETPFSQ
jgi:hypothetical protein